MDYKLICLDMDGTLLSDTSNITQENLDAIKEAHEKGVKIAISTGRIFTSANFYSDLLGVKSPVIAGNGAVVIEKDENRVVYKGEIGRLNVIKFMELCEQEELKPYVYTIDSVMYDKDLPQIAIDFITSAYKGKYSEDRPTKFVEVDDWKKVIDEHGDDIIKCLSIHEDVNKINKMKELLDEEGNMDGVRPMPQLVEATRKGVNKGVAVDMLANYYGIKPEEVICVGDSENDLSMIKYAGLGVAMGNGSDEIKALADYVTDTNTNSGVAKAIQKFILDK